MHRRSLLRGLSSALLMTSITEYASGESAGSRTRWKVRSSEGFDAIAFLGPLSGISLYLTYYGDEAAAFAPRLSPAARGDATRLWNEATKEGFGLLGPNLQVLFSTRGNDACLDTLVCAVQNRATAILPDYRASRYWNADDWAWFDRAAPRIEAIFSAMRIAGFSAFRSECIGDHLDTRIAEVARGLHTYDVVRWQEKLTGRRFEPEIEVVLLHFSKPHGIKVQGQTFLQAADYDIDTTVRIAAHEMLHPPVPMDGRAAVAALNVLGRDALLNRIVREHDPRWGYGTLKGLLDEDLVQALDQLISEALGVARQPAKRWRDSDDGMHVLAAGLYGLLREDGWTNKGGSIENWLADAARRRRLSPRLLHRVAARVLQRPADALWPLAESAPSDGARPSTDSLSGASTPLKKSAVH
jgi:hypothetical protein